MRRLCLLLLGVSVAVLLGAETLTLTGETLPVESFTTEEDMLLKVDRPKSSADYQLFFGPHPIATGDPNHLDFGQPASAKIEKKDGNWRVTVSNNGFIYVAGIQPYGGTDGGSATSDGSVLVVERTRESATRSVHRYYYVSRWDPSHEMTVKTEEAVPGTHNVGSLHQYLEIVVLGGDYSINGPNDISSASQDIKDFVNEVLDRADAKGLGAPSVRY
ncbi:MAG: hypothetical protein ACYTGE_13085 [Planctomycetota bacterium]|jgi:hypothetical protein